MAKEGWPLSSFLFVLGGRLVCQVRLLFAVHEGAHRARNMSATPRKISIKSPQIAAPPGQSRIGASIRMPFTESQLRVAERDPYEENIYIVRAGFSGPPSGKGHKSQVPFLTNRTQFWNRVINAKQRTALPRKRTQIWQSYPRHRVIHAKQRTALRRRNEPNFLDAGSGSGMTIG